MRLLERMKRDSAVSLGNVVSNQLNPRGSDAHTASQLLMPSSHQMGSHSGSLTGLCKKAAFLAQPKVLTIVSKVLKTVLKFMKDCV